jgi:hypothetical protein
MPPPSAHRRTSCVNATSTPFATDALGGSSPPTLGLSALGLSALVTRGATGATGGLNRSDVTTKAFPYVPSRDLIRSNRHEGAS